MKTYYYLKPSSSDATAHYIHYPSENSFEFMAQMKKQTCREAAFEALRREIGDVKVILKSSILHDGQRYYIFSEV